MNRMKAQDRRVPVALHWTNRMPPGGNTIENDIVKDTRDSANLGESQAFISKMQDFREFHK